MGNTKTKNQTFKFLELIGELLVNSKSWVEICSKFEVQFYKKGNEDSPIIKWEEFYDIFLKSKKIFKFDEEALVNRTKGIAPNLVQSPINFDYVISYYALNEVFSTSFMEMRIYRLYILFLINTIEDSSQISKLNFIELIFEKIIYNIEIESKEYIDDEEYNSNMTKNKKRNNIDDNSNMLNNLTVIDMSFDKIEEIDNDYSMTRKIYKIDKEAINEDEDSSYDSNEESKSNQNTNSEEMSNSNSNSNTNSNETNSDYTKSNINIEDNKYSKSEGDNSKQIKEMSNESRSSEYNYTFKPSNTQKNMNSSVSNTNSKEKPRIKNINKKSDKLNKLNNKYTSNNTNKSKKESINNNQSLELSHLSKTKTSNSLAISHFSQNFTNSNSNSNSEGDESDSHHDGFFLNNNSVDEKLVQMFYKFRLSKIGQNKTYVKKITLSMFKLILYMYFETTIVNVLYGFKKTLEKIQGNKTKLKDVYWNNELKNFIKKNYDYNKIIDLSKFDLRAFLIFINKAMDNFVNTRDNLKLQIERRDEMLKKKEKRKRKNPSENSKDRKLELSLELKNKEAVEGSSNLKEIVDDDKESTNTLKYKHDWLIINFDDIYAFMHKNDYFFNSQLLYKTYVSYLDVDIDVKSNPFWL